MSYPKPPAWEHTGFHWVRWRFVQSYRMVDMIHFYPDLSAEIWPFANLESLNDKGLGSQSTFIWNFVPNDVWQIHCVTGLTGLMKRNGLRRQMSGYKPTCRMRGEGVKIKVLARKLLDLQHQSFILKLPRRDNTGIGTLR